MPHHFCAKLPIDKCGRMCYNWRPGDECLGPNFHYTTPHRICQEENCTKKTFLEIPILCILPIAIRGQMWYIIIVPRESGSPKHLEKSLKKMKKTLDKPLQV